MEDKTVKEFFSILLRISEKTREEGIAEGKNAGELEKEIARQWENLIDNSLAKNRRFYSPQEYAAIKDEEDGEEGERQALEMTEVIRKASAIATEARFIDGEYVQNRNSYLIGLP